jgi:RNA polymerase sigma factor (sigma-70 family)
MARPSSESVRRILRLAGQEPGGHASDRDLVTRFAQDRDESAFADLMARHGPMVLAVCRRAVRDPHAADDAFQATFLVLAHKAGRVAWKESIGGWLFQVAHRVAKKVAAQAARRNARETASAVEPVAPAAAPPSDLTALQAALDDELRRLPEKLRVPVVLCHLEGLPQDDVAKHLGVTDGQLRGRLYRAKEKLRARLTRRGFSLTAVLLALTVGDKASALPPVLAAGTLRLSVGGGSAPVAVSVLVQHVSSDMWYSSKSFAALVLVGVVGLGAGGVALRHAAAEGERPRVSGPSVAAIPLPAPEPAPEPARQDDEKMPDAKEKLEVVSYRIVEVTASPPTLKLKPDDEGQPLVTWGFTDTASVTFAKKPAKLTDLKVGMRADLAYKGNSNVVVEVRASWPAQKVAAKGIDAAKGTFAFEAEGGFEVSLAVEPGAKVEVDDLPAGLADIPPGRKVELNLTIDKKGAVGLKADGDKGDIPVGIVKYDAVAKALLVRLEADHDDVRREVTLSLPVAADAKVRHAGKDAQLADLKDRMPARLRMSADRRTVVGLLVGDPKPADKDDD